MIDVQPDEIKEDDGQKASLTSYQKFEMGALSFEFVPEREGEFKVQWTVCGNNGEVVRTGIVDKEALWSLAFLIANDEMKEKLIPVKTHENRVFRQVKTVTLKRDLPAGTELKVPFKFTVPLEVLVKASQSGLIKPQ